MEYNKMIRDMLPGDQVEGYFALRTAQSRTSNSGKPFLAASVADRSGAIDAKAWDYAGPISGGRCRSSGGRRSSPLSASVWQGRTTRWI